MSAPQRMTGSADDMVRWYAGALAGRWFAQADTLREFRRIHAMADALALVVPAGLAAYGKGGSIDWEGFHALSVPGQMVVGGAPPRSASPSTGAAAPTACSACLNSWPRWHPCCRPPPTRSAPDTESRAR
jgi:hypothetical protein